MKIIKALSVATLMGLFSVANAAVGNIAVSPLIVDMAPGAQFQDITVSNVGSGKAYVKVSLAKWNNPGAKNASIVPESGSPMAFGIAMTPEKLAISPNQNRAVRVINFNKNVQQDIVYIATISPVASLVEGNANAGDTNINVGVQISVSYKVKVFVRPSNPHANLTIVRHGKSAVITNNGNTNALVTGFKQCNADGSDCKDLDLINRLYAGNSWTVTLPNDAPFQFTETYLANNQVIKSQ